MKRPAMPATRGRARRWLLGGAAVVAALLVGCEIQGWTFLRPLLEADASRRAGTALQVQGAFRMQLLWNPGIDAQHLVVAPAAGFDAPVLVDATDLQARWRWTDLLRWRQGGPLRIHALSAQSLQANLERHADGRANWQFRHDRPPVKPGASAWPRFGTLRVGAGRIHLVDGVRGHDLVLDIRGGEGAVIAASGYDAHLGGHYRQLPVDLAIRAGGALPLLQDESTTERVPLRVQGMAGASQLLFDGGAASLITTQRLAGKLHFKGPSLAAVGEPVGVTLPRTPPFDISGRLGHDGTVWHLVAEQALIGHSRLGGDFRFDSKAQPRRLTGRLTGERLLLADLGPAVGTNGPDLPRPSARVLPQRRFDLPSLHTMEADVGIALAELDFGGRALTPFRDVRTQLSLHGGVLRLDALQAGAAGGRVEGWSQYDTRKPPAGWSVDLAFIRLDLAGWIRGLRKSDPGTSAPVYLTGDMSGRVRLQGRGGSTAEILSTLDGSVQARLDGGSMSHLLTEFAGLDVAQALGVAVRGDRPLPLRCAAVDLAVKDGVVVPRRAVFDNRDSTIAVAGTIDLRDETLALKASARPKDMTPFSLRTPVTVTGTLSHPKVGVQMLPLAGRVAVAVGLGLIAGPAALLPFVDPGSRPAADPCS